MICASIWWFFCHCLQSLTLSVNSLLICYFDTCHKFICCAKWQYSAGQMCRNFSPQLQHWAARGFGNEWHFLQLRKWKNGEKTYPFWWKWTTRHGSINSKFHDQIGYVLLSDSGKCVCVAKSNFLLNMNYCSGQREICTGMSGHQSNTKFLIDLITFLYGSGTEVWTGLIILHSSSQSTCSTCNKCLYMKQVCLIQNHKTKICSLLLHTIQTWTA